MSDENKNVESEVGLNAVKTRVPSAGRRLSLTSPASQPPVGGPTVEGEPIEAIEATEAIEPRVLATDKVVTKDGGNAPTGSNGSPALTQIMEGGKGPPSLTQVMEGGSRARNKVGLQLPLQTPVLSSSDGPSWKTVRMLAEMANDAYEVKFEDTTAQKLQNGKWGSQWERWNKDEANVIWKVVYEGLGGPMLQKPIFEQDLDDAPKFYVTQELTSDGLEAVTQTLTLRGTHLASGLDDLFTDADLLKQTEFYADGSTDSLFSSIKDFLYGKSDEAPKVTFDGQAVHRGFGRAALIIAKCLEENNILTSAPIRICGHSLGGSVAALLAVILREKGFAIDCIVSFGAPAVTDKAGATFWTDTERKLPWYRILNTRDPICTLPPFVYCHGGMEYCFDSKDGRAVQFLGIFGRKTDNNPLKLKSMLVDMDNHTMKHPSRGYILSFISQKNKRAKAVGVGPGKHKFGLPVFQRSVDVDTDVIAASRIGAWWSITSPHCIRSDLGMRFIGGIRARGLDARCILSIIGRRVELRSFSVGKTLRGSKSLGN